MDPWKPYHFELVEGGVGLDAVTPPGVFASFLVGLYLG